MRGGLISFLSDPVQAIKEIRDKVQLATKYGFGIDATGTLCVRGDPAYVRACCEASLKRLGVDCIDLYYQHRMDPNVPIEETVSRSPDRRTNALSNCHTI